MDRILLFSSVFVKYLRSESKVISSFQDKSYSLFLYYIILLFSVPAFSKLLIFRTVLLLKYMFLQLCAIKPFKYWSPHQQIQLYISTGQTSFFQTVILRTGQLYGANILKKCLQTLTRVNNNTITQENVQRTYEAILLWFYLYNCLNLLFPSVSLCSVRVATFALIQRKCDTEPLQT